MVAIKCVWDFNATLADTFREKCEGLYVKLVELSNMLTAAAKDIEGEDTQLVLNAGQDIAGIFDTGGTPGFFPGDKYEYFVRDHAKGDGRVYLGTLNMKWRLYLATKLPRNQFSVEYQVKQEGVWNTFGIADMTVTNLPES